LETKAVLDTSILVDFVRNKDGAVENIRKLSEAYELCMTDINVFELFYGAYISKNTDKNLAAVKGLIGTLLVFNTSNESMEISARIASELDRKGEKLEMRDVFIAGICLLHSCPIITRNKNHFERAGVKVAEEI
jgi:predicted nucleic acid-binding protein